MVPMWGGLVPATHEPREKVIEALERALEAAQSGEVQGVALACFHADGLSSHTLAGCVGSYGLIGAAQVLVHKLTLAAMDGDE